jgi:hypothetical protein
LWRALEYKVSDVQQICRVCAKLHNLCVDSFLQGRGPLEPVPHGRDSASMFSLHPTIDDALDEDGFPENDATVTSELENNYGAQERQLGRPVTTTRHRLRVRMFELGFRFSSTLEDCFQLPTELTAEQDEQERQIEV